MGDKRQRARREAGPGGQALQVKLLRPRLEADGETESASRKVSPRPKWARKTGAGKSGVP